MAAKKIECSPVLIQTARSMGYSWRQIAGALGCTVAGLLIHLKKSDYKEPESRSMARPKIPLNALLLKVENLSLPLQTP